MSRQVYPWAFHLYHFYLRLALLSWSFENAVFQTALLSIPNEAENSMPTSNGHSHTGHSLVIWGDCRPAQMSVWVPPTETSCSKDPSLGRWWTECLVNIWTCAMTVHGRKPHLPSRLWCYHILSQNHIDSLSPVTEDRNSRLLNVDRQQRCSYLLSASNGLNWQAH